MSDPYQIDALTREQMQALIDAPLAEVGKINLPMGKRSPKRGPKPIYENEFAPAITGKEARERREAERDKKIGAVLNYYAGTDIPFDRIAANTKLDIDTVIRVMAQRGRTQ